MPRTSIYPNGIDGYSQIRLVRDNIEEIVADDNNALRSAVIQIEQTLGIRPQSTFGTVDARIEALETGAAAISDGRLKVSANDTIFNFLNPKISEGLNIEKQELNDGANEQLELGTTETLRLPNQTTNPPIIVNSGHIFTNDGYDAYGIATGRTELFYQDDYAAGAITQITDDGYLATASSLRRIGLFAQSSVDVPNVLGKAYLYAQNISGITELMYRDSYGTSSQITDDGYLSGFPLTNLIIPGFAFIGGNATVAGDGYFQSDLGVAGELDVDGYANFDNSLGVKVDLTVDNDANIGNDIYVQGNIDGQGNLDVVGNLDIDGTSNVDGYANFNDSIGVKNNITVDNNLFITGISDLTGNIHGFGDFELDGNGEIHGTSNVDGYANFNDSIGVKNNITVDNDTNIGNDIYVQGNIDSQSNIDANGNLGCGGDVNATGNINASSNVNVDGYLIAREGLLIEEMADPPFQQLGASFLYSEPTQGNLELFNMDEVGNATQFTQAGLVGLRGPLQNNIMFVGSGGYSFPSIFDGYDIGSRFDNFTDAINVIEGYGSGNEFTIVCLDSATYNEFLDVPQYISIYAPNAILSTPNGVFGVDYAITLNSNSKIVFGQINPGNDVGAVLRTNAASLTDDAIIKVDSVRLQGQSVGFLNVDSGANEVLNIKCNKITVDNNGFAIGSLITGLGHAVIDIGSIYLNGANTYGIAQLSGEISGNIKSIEGVGLSQTAIYMTNDTINVNINKIDTDIKYDLQGGVFRSFINEAIGSTIVAAGVEPMITYAGQIPPYSFNSLFGDVALVADDGYGATMVDTTFGNVTVTLPENETLLAGSSLIFKKIDAAANDMIIEGYGGRQIDGAANLSTNIQYTSYTLLSDGYEWNII
jgi:predicted acyltransferase (DUF342 family)